MQSGFAVHKNDVVVDLGANAGLFTTLAAANGQRVVAIEAQSEYIPIIEGQLARNHCSERATVVHALLGDTSGMLGNARGRETASHWKIAPASQSMQDIVRTHNLDRIDLLKVDIEGSEFDLFQEPGWLAVVDRIVMEVHPQFGSVQDLCRQVEAAGLSTILVESNSGRRVQTLGDSQGFLFAKR